MTGTILIYVPGCNGEAEEGRKNLNNNEDNIKNLYSRRSTCTLTGKNQNHDWLSWSGCHNISRVRSQWESQCRGLRWEGGLPRPRLRPPGPGPAPRPEAPALLPRLAGGGAHPQDQDDQADPVIWRGGHSGVLTIGRHSPPTVLFHPLHSVQPSRIICLSCSFKIN